MPERQISLQDHLIDAAGMTLKFSLSHLESSPHHYAWACFCTARSQRWYAFTAEMEYMLRIAQMLTQLCICIHHGARSHPAKAWQQHDETPKRHTHTDTHTSCRGSLSRARCTEVPGCIDRRGSPRMSMSCLSICSNFAVQAWHIRRGST